MRPPARPILAVAATITLGLGLGVGNAAAFALRAAGLETNWNALERAGVPAAQVAPLRARVQQEQARRLGPIPYSVLSDALLRDPLAASEQQTQTLREEQLAASRAEAVAALGRLEITEGTESSASRLARQRTLDRADTPADYRRLAAQFDNDAGLAGEQAVRDLEAVSGGLVDGRPADILAAESGLEAQAGRARAQGMPTDPAPFALDEAARYLLLPSGLELADHDSVKGDLMAASAQIEARLSTRNHAGALLAQASDLVAQLADLSGSAGDYPDRLARAQAALSAAAGDAELAAAAATAVSLVSDLEAELARFNLPPAMTAGDTCIGSAPPKLIVVHLASESLIAYENGCPIVQTLVTTGRPALRTDRGDFHIFSKRSPYKFVSPWPLGSPFWYHSAWVSWAMEIVADGTYLHDAPWQPADTFGPGSEDGPWASHGCVHIPTEVMRMLYTWAPIGTEVMVGA